MPILKVEPNIVNSNAAFTVGSITAGDVTVGNTIVFSGPNGPVNLTANSVQFISNIASGGLLTGSQTLSIEMRSGPAVSVTTSQGTAMIITRSGSVEVSLT